MVVVVVEVVVEEGGAIAKPFISPTLPFPAPWGLQFPLWKQYRVSNSFKGSSMHNTRAGYKYRPLYLSPSPSTCTFFKYKSQILI